MSVTIDQSDRAEILEALAYHVKTCKRIPRHHTDRLALLHARIDALLDDLELLGWHETP